MVISLMTLVFCAIPLTKDIYLSFIRILIRIIYLIRVHRISMIHSWLYHADLVSSLVSLVCHLPVIWHIHNSKICTLALLRSVHLYFILIPF